MYRSSTQEPELPRNNAPARTVTGSEDIIGKRIAVFSAHPSFITDIVEYLSRNNEARLFERPTPERVERASQWADLAWFEWCDDSLIAATGRPKHCPTVCRLHSYEVFTDMPGRVDWTKVDHLVFVNESVQTLFERQVQCRTPRSVIHNGVDTDRFVIPEPKQPTKKIASVGYINYKKNPALLLYCFKKIHEYDSRYTLHIAGEFQDSRYQLYFEHFLSRNPLPVMFDGWIGDMPAWYADKDFVISTSLFESFHYSIAEGMSSGVLPLVHDWFGAENLYPEQYLFSDPDGCLALVRQLEDSNRPALIDENRRYVISRYASRDKCREIGQLLNEVLTRARNLNKVKA